MRRLLGVLHDGEPGAALGPQSGLDRLDLLLAEVRDAGLPVRLRVEGDAAPLPPGVDVCAHRIVQEGLASALQRAGAEPVDVVLQWSRGSFELELADDGAGLAETGLAGVREHVEVCGGELEAGPRPEGGFRVRARLPVEAS